MHYHEVLDGAMGLDMCWLQVLGQSGCILNVLIVLLIVSGLLMVDVVCLCVSWACLVA